MREPAWNKPISICSFSHAAILNVWSSHCPLAIDPRQRRTRNHQPVPTLTRKDDAGAGIMLQSRMRSAALLVLAAGMAATSATAKPPGGGPPGAHPGPAPAPHAAPAPRAAAPHIAAPRAAPPPPRAAPPRITAAPRTAPPAPRHSKLRGLPAAPHPPPARERAHEQAQDMGRRIERSSLRRQRNAREVEVDPILPSLRCGSGRHVSLRSPRNRRPPNHRQRPPEPRRARGAQPNPARLCSRQT